MSIIDGLELDELRDKAKRLDEIAAAFETVRESRNGLISNHALYNLEAAIEDIERTGKCDAVSLGTLKRVHGQLSVIYRALPRS